MANNGNDANNSLRRRWRDEVFAKLTDGKTIHTIADRMELDTENNAIFVYDGDHLVAFVDISTVLYAHLVQKNS